MRKPNIVIIMADQLKASALGIYGNRAAFGRTATIRWMPWMNCTTSAQTRMSGGATSLPLPPGP